MISRVAQITKTVSQPRVVYRTITPNLDTWPRTGELKTLLNQDAVIQSIKNLVQTRLKERYYHLDIGSLLERGLFDFADEFGADRIKQELTDTLNNWEQRAQNPQITVTAIPGQQAYNVDIQFTIAAAGAVVSVPTIVLRVR